MKAQAIHAKLIAPLMILLVSLMSACARPARPASGPELEQRVQNNIFNHYVEKKREQAKVDRTAFLFELYQYIQ